MNKKYKTGVLCTLSLLVLVNMAPLLLRASQTAHPRTLSVSIPKLQVSTKERVVGFEIHIASGRVAALPNIPIGWGMSIDNDPSWNTKVTGTSRVGAAAVTPGFFREFLFVEKDQSPVVPFRISGEVVVTEDFVTGRHIQITSGDFVLKESVPLDSATNR